MRGIAMCQNAHFMHGAKTERVDASVRDLSNSIANALE